MTTAPADLSSPLIYDGRVNAAPRQVDPGECTCTYTEETA